MLPGSRPGLPQPSRALLVLCDPSYPSFPDSWSVTGVCAELSPAAAAMEASAAQAAAVKTAKAGLPSEGVASRKPAMAETTEGARVHADRCARDDGAVTRTVEVAFAR